VEVIPELTYDVVAGGLSIQNLHERGLALCSAKSASVCFVTELQNSSSVSCSEASPSASRVSSSSGVPVKPGCALLNGCQSSFDNLINGFVSTAAEDRSNPALLFRRETNRHGVVASWVRHLQVRAKTAVGQVGCGFGGFGQAERAVRPGSV